VLKGIGSGYEKWVSYNLLGVLKRELGLMAEAETALAAAIRLAPSEWSNYNILGNIYKKAGRDKEAGEMYKKALELAPGDYKAGIREKMGNGSK
jgi:Flp pilus assembly protein TadD